MPRVHTQISSELDPATVLKVLTDFGPARSKVWPGVDDQHLTVHDQRAGWADVTEGNNIGWERQTYTWDTAAGTVSSETTESNLWGPGSRWDYKITPENGGSLLDVTLVRNGKGIKGKLIGTLVSLGGQRMITKQFTEALKRASAS